MHARTSRIRNTTTTLFALATMFAGAAALAAPSDDEIIYDLRLELNFEADNLEQVHHEIDRIFSKYNSPALAAQMLELSRQDFANDSLDETHADFFHLALLMKKLGDDRLIDEAFADHLNVNDVRFGTIVSALTLSTTDRAYEALRKRADSLTSELVKRIKSGEPFDDHLYGRMLATLAHSSNPKLVAVAAKMRQTLFEEFGHVEPFRPYFDELDQLAPNLKRMKPAKAAAPDAKADPSANPTGAGPASPIGAANTAEKGRFKTAAPVWMAGGIAVFAGLVFLVSRWLK